jgi:quercetin dioxygenase-like cupin family protein
MATLNTMTFHQRWSNLMKSKHLLAAALLVVGAGILTTTDVQGETASKAVSGSQVIELPKNAGSGDGKSVSVLLDESHLKLATIALRQGTPLPTHSAPVPATILVLEGEGVMHVGGQPVPVSEGTIVSLAAGEEHDVVPTPGGDMLLLVHYLRGAQGNKSPPTADHDH